LKRHGMRSNDRNCGSTAHSATAENSPCKLKQFGGLTLRCPGRHNVSAIISVMPRRFNCRINICTLSSDEVLFCQLQTNEIENACHGELLFEKCNDKYTGRRACAPIPCSGLSAMSLNQWCLMFFSRLPLRLKTISFFSRNRWLNSKIHTINSSLNFILLISDFPRACQFDDL